MGFVRRLSLGEITIKSKNTFKPLNKAVSVALRSSAGLVLGDARLEPTKPRFFVNAIRNERSFFLL
jgi:hypothetical protein